MIPDNVAHVVLDGSKLRVASLHYRVPYASRQRSIFALPTVGVAQWMSRMVWGDISSSSFQRHRSESGAECSPELRTAVAVMH